MFLTYRWIAWGIAALVIGLSNQPLYQQPHHVWLLIFAAIINGVMTFQGQRYVAFARRLPVLLLLDVVVSIVVVWMSACSMLPFLPYASASLVLPMLVLNRKIALIVVLAFVFLDQAGLFISGSVQGMALLQTFVRAVAPVGFAFVGVGFLWLVQHSAESSSDATNEEDQDTVVDNPNEPIEDLGPFEHVSGTESTHQSDMPESEKRSHDTSTAMTKTKPVWRVVPVETYTLAEYDTQDVRRIMYELTPNVDVDLSVALNHLVEHFRSCSGVTIRMILNGDEKRVTPVQYITLFRLAQEALINIQQHAQAQHGLLQLSYGTHIVMLTIQDDGVGLLDGTYVRPGVHALRAVSYRLAEIDGFLEVVDSESGGLTVRGILPLM